MEHETDGSGGVCRGISKQTMIAALFVSIIPSFVDIFTKIILDEFHLPFLSIVIDSALLLFFLMSVFIYTHILCPSNATDVISSPFWMTQLFGNITNHLHLKCILFLLLLSLFWSGNCIFTYLATLCDVPSFVGMLKGFVSPGLLFASCVFGGKEELNSLKIVSILFYAFGEIMIDFGDVTFSTDCLFLAIIAVICTTGKYFMIEKVMNCKLSKKIDYNIVSDPYSEDDVETDQLLPSIDQQLEIETDKIDIVEIGNIEMINLDGRRQDFESNTNDPSIDTYNHQIVEMRKNELLSLENEVVNELNDGDIHKSEHMESISTLLAFGYILPLQILIGIIVFMNEEYEDVMYNQESESYKSVRDGWYWGSRIIQNGVFSVIYWAEMHLVGEFSAVYMMVFGAIRNVSTLILSWIILKYKLTMYGWMGYFIAICAVSAFQFARKFDKKET